MIIFESNIWKPLDSFYNIYKILSSGIATKCVKVLMDEIADFTEIQNPHNVDV